MVFNYHFLEHLVPQLQQLWREAVLVTAFSQNRDELILGFGTPEGDSYMRLNWGSPVPTMDWPANFNRARRNSIDLFTPALGQPVSTIGLLPNERGFVLKLGRSLRLVFKLYGRHGNVLLFEDGQLIELFRHSLGKDKVATLDQFGHVLDQSYEALVQANGNWKKLYPTLGDLAQDWLVARNYDTLDLRGQYALLQELLGIMDQGRFQIISKDDTPRLTLMPQEPDSPATPVFTDPIAAANAFAQAVFRRYGLEYEREQLQKTLQKRLQQTESYLAKTWQRLTELEEGLQPNQLADLVMANLHHIKPGTSQITVEDFYNGGEVTIKLNPAATAQKSAETLYRKARNRKLEVERLQDNLQAREAERALYLQHLAALPTLENVRHLRQYVKDHQLQPMSAEQAEALPWHRFEHQGYEILVGRHANGNEQLTFRSGHKNDLWLHARDVPGSHVIVRLQAGKTIPTPVIQYAASLAARFSKRRNESLVPVQMTQRKNVSRIKGAAPGKVKLDREEVIMVRPAEL